MKAARYTALLIQHEARQSHHSLCYLWLVVRRISLGTKINSYIYHDDGNSQAITGLEGWFVTW